MRNADILALDERAIRMAKKGMIEMTPELEEYLKMAEDELADANEDNSNGLRYAWADGISSTHGNVSDYIRDSQEISTPATADDVDNAQLFIGEVLGFNMNDTDIVFDPDKMLCAINDNISELREFVESVSGGEYIESMEDLANNEYNCDDDIDAINYASSRVISDMSVVDELCEEVECCIDNDSGESLKALSLAAVLAGNGVTPKIIICPNDNIVSGDKRDMFVVGVDMTSCTSDISSVIDTLLDAANSITAEGVLLDANSVTALIVD